MIFDPTNSLGGHQGLVPTFGSMSRAAAWVPITLADLDRLALACEQVGGFIAIGGNEPEPPMTDSETEEAMKALRVRLARPFTVQKD